MSSYRSPQYDVYTIGTFDEQTKPHRVMPGPGSLGAKWHELPPH